jgi:hypothetical protein
MFDIIFVIGTPYQYPEDFEKINVFKNINIFVHFLKKCKTSINIFNQQKIYTIQTKLF